MSPENREVERVAALRALHLLDTPPEDRFDRITRLARDLFDMPIALVSLVDVDRQWTKSKAGAALCETPRALSFCTHVVDSGTLVEIPDALTDPRFAHNPVVVGGPRLRFYAGVPVLSPSGHVIGTLCLLDRVPRSLTGRQRAELGELAAWVELECATVRSNRWEQETERARRDFVSVVSHELRTPLTSIHGSLELIASGRFGELPPQVGRLVGIAARNTDRLVRLSQDVVDLHQAHRGQLRLRLDAVVLPDVVRQAVDAVGEVADRAGVSMAVVCAKSAEVRGDADRLVQVVTNLLVNAARVSPRGGRVTVTCGVRGSWARIEVRDHGPGVPQGQLDEIFEPFVQFDVPGQRRTGGAGLGLAIARGIVEAHGGRIGARPADGGGSAFEVALPAAGPDVDLAWW
ncbi:GAF domain-containing sensor histidine kinase [Umezawaea sp. Da 62-37]|uniref:GAF domain-containing sensor histidine kinase n=1 Tax=Umezawaea sp. Da 62-37 TaxID=3075927 RepID=UPI0028F6F5FB|nr:GAF domain-containing sensor histidine kinase [Umezawaea sp. Da 62-37]WNV87248.1 GAF domain-containing sensor histidine kinase [Umezawaea sp. Da 62-37]